MEERKVDIKVISGVSAGDIFHFRVSSASPLSIGREPSCGLVLQDPLVSRRHATIELEEENFYIVDQGSTHGTVHMGFQLQPGAQGRRPLKSGDEFKIGDEIFAIHFEEAPSVEKKKASEKKEKRGVPFASSMGGRGLIYIGIGAVLVILLLFSGEEEGPKLPRQNKRAYQARSLPEYRVLGYLPGGRGVKQTRKDTSHPDQVVFYLPTADTVVEYDYISQAKVEVYIDKLLVDTLPPHPTSWQHRQIIVRDILSGQERKLIFDNTDLPRSKKDMKRKVKRWAVKNVRTSPISRDLDTSFELLLNQTAALASQIEATPEALFSLIKALRKCIVEALAQTGSQAVGLGIDLEMGLVSGGGDSEELDPLAPALLAERLVTIRKEREDRLSAATPNLHLTALVEMMAKLDAELWRRFNSRINGAKRAAQSKTYIDAYDNLMAARKMFPDEDDLRWMRAERMFKDNKIVPKKVRARPGKYRK